jgi:menaquinone-dependent protoporphyrinogen oxidase
MGAERLSLDNSPGKSIKTLIEEMKMTDQVLVAYASRMDSTRGVAEAIGKILSTSGYPVDVLPVGEVKSLDGYKGVVVGSAIQAGVWLPEAMQFVSKYQSQLRRIPTAAFLVCMTLAMKKSQYREHVATWMQPVRSLIKPVSEGLFAGALDLKKLPSIGDRIKFKISVLLGVWGEGDHRDWAEIEAWAKTLPKYFK